MLSIAKHRRRMICVSLTAVLIGGVMTACGGGSGAGSAQTAEPAQTAATPAATTAAAAKNTDASNGSTPSKAAADLSLPISKEKITLTAFWPAPANVLKFITDFNQGSIWPVLEKQTNIHIQWQHGTDEQRQLILNSGDLPDIFFAGAMSNHYPGGGDKAIADGVYLKLNDYLDKYGKNYTKLINSTPEFRKNSRTDSGNIWGFAMLETKIQGAWMGMTVRQDWLDDLSIPTPVTFDDWHNMLLRFKNEKGATAPLLLPTTLFDWADAFISGYGVGQAFYQVDGVVKYGPIEPGFRDFITMLAKWYSEGLIDKDFATRDTDSFNQLIYTGQCGAWYDGFWMLNYNKTHSQEPDKYHQYAVPNPVVKAGDVAHLRQVNYNVRDEWAAVSAKTKYPVETVRWLDNLYSDQNYILTNYGVEGEGYNIVNGEYVLSDLITHNPDGLVMAEALFRYAMHDGPMWRIWDREKVGWTPDEIACEQIWDTADASYVVPLVTLTADESAESTAIINDAKTYVQETGIRYVMGLEDISKFDTFVQTIKGMNIQRAIEIEQAALDRYNKR